MPIFTKRIPMTAHASLKLGDVLGGGRLEINGVGGMILDFYPHTRRPWRIRVRGVSLAWETFVLPLPNGERLVVDDFRVSNPDFNLEGCYGTYDPATQRVLLHLDIQLSPERIPQLRALGVKEVLRVVVDEEGKMDFVQGRIIQTHARAFQIPSNLPRGLIEVRAGQKSCEAVGHLFVAIADSGLTKEEVARYRPKSVIICPTTKILLGWEMNPLAKVKTATITGGPESIEVPTTQNTGSQSAAPQQDTTFTLEVSDTGGCVNKDSVDVTVVKAGTTFTIQAQKVGPLLWEVKLPAFSFDPKIRVTAIHSALCFSEDSAYAHWGFYKQDVDGAITVGNIGPVDLPLAPVPLAGIWQFSPTDVGTLITAPGYDPEYDRIPPSEENIACFVAHLAC